jgi:hypothetical protein
MALPSASWYAIFQEHSRHADRIEPVTDLGSFQIVRQDAVSASGTDDHCRPGVLVGRGAKDGYRRLAHIAQANDVGPRLGLRIVLGRVLLFADVTFLARRRARPKGDDLVVGSIGFGGVIGRSAVK